jgi:thiol-disulfide isomerase/thioredoxin
MVVKKVITAFILLFVIAGCESKTDTESKKEEVQENNSSVKEETTPKIEEEAKRAEVLDGITFKLETIDGKSINIREIENGLEFKEFKGKAIFLVLFGHRCPPCLREIPELIELTKEHKDLQVVGIEVQGLDSDALEEFASERGINYSLISGDGNMDFIGYIQAKASWNGSIPFLLGLDKSGQVQIIHIGGIPKRVFETAYQMLIK